MSAVTALSDLTALPDDSLPGFQTPHDFFEYLDSLLNHADENKGNESSLYGPYTFIFTQFSIHAMVEARRRRMHRLRLGCFPQKDLKPGATGVDGMRIPDITTVVTQGRVGSGADKVGDAMAFLVEIKPGLQHEPLMWHGEAMSDENDFSRTFTSHIPQITEQARYARSKFKITQTSVCVFLIVDVWFALFEFASDSPPPSVHRAQNDKQVFYAGEEYCIVSPATVFNANWTGFSPTFLRALHLAVQTQPDYVITPHAFFTPPEGTQESASARMARDALNKEIAQAIEARAKDARQAIGEGALRPEDEPEIKPASSREGTSPYRPHNPATSALILEDHPYVKSPRRTRASGAATSPSKIPQLKGLRREDKKSRKNTASK